MRQNKKLMILSIFVMVLSTVLLGGSYAFFTTKNYGKEYAIYTGNLKVDYLKKTDTIQLENLYPMTDQEGLKLASHQFVVKNNGNINARYQVRLEHEQGYHQIDPKYIKLSYSIDNKGYSEPILLSELNSSYIFMKNQILISGESNEIGIKLWIDSSAPNEIQGKEFRVRVVVDSIQEMEEEYPVDTSPIITLNGSDIHLKVGERYQELGIEKIEDDKDNLSIENIIISYEAYRDNDLIPVDSINTNQIGIYYATYSITDSGNNTSKAIRVVTVNPSDTIPNITLKGNATETVYQYQEYQELGVNFDSNHSLLMVGEIKTSVLGTQMLRYIVMDNNGNLNSVVRTVNVEKAYLNKVILYHNEVNTNPPTLTTTSEIANEKGLYVSTETNSGNATYYFRGNIGNNYIEFAGFTWRIVRINEDGTTRLILEEGINNNNPYIFHSKYDDEQYMYYTNSAVKKELENWYQINLSNYSKYISAGDYFCEQYKTNDTKPNFLCLQDINGMGKVSTNIGLLTYDEVAYAGGIVGTASNFYLKNNHHFWTMSSSGFKDNAAVSVFGVASEGSIGFFYVLGSGQEDILRPVINLKQDVEVRGIGTKENPYIVQ